ncbi:MAG: hypothetical protein HYS09_10225 [Chloroflexi bacterium]|nr:hypothetical protein [Chloroflexota bacterium]
MEERIIVLVTDRDDDKHGEISILDDAVKAERLVETLLEAGFEQERIRVFKGDELNLKVNLRPVVSLAGEGEVQPEEPPAVAEPPAEPAEGEGEGTEKPESARFSSLFRSG